MSVAKPNNDLDSTKGMTPILVLDEQNEKLMPTHKAEYDPVKRIISILFKNEQSLKYVQCGVALRASGSLDFIWNFRVVDSLIISDIVVDGFVEDISGDFGFIYFRKISFENSKKLLNDLDNPKSETYKNFSAVFSDSDSDSSSDEDIDFNKPGCEELHK